MQSHLVSSSLPDFNGKNRYLYSEGFPQKETFKMQISSHAQSQYIDLLGLPSNRVLPKAVNEMQSRITKSVSTFK